MENKQMVNAGGINGVGEGLINPHAADVKALQAMIKKASANQDEQEKIENQFLSIRFQMETYLTQPVETIIPAGQFINKYLKVIKIKKKDLATYLGYENSNLSAMINGRRKINSEIAIKLGQIFSLNPAIWLHLESKNELIQTMREKEKNTKQYSLTDLMNKAG
ncbi:MAG: hypothetical protein NWR72_08575 [Bacteroidia bacterium]|nr:hypothetical protein [Bacteroidia bacterium]